MALVSSCQPYAESITAVLSCSCPGVLKSTDFYHFATGVVLICLKQKGWNFICVKHLFQEVNHVLAQIYYIMLVFRSFFKVVCEKLSQEGSSLMNS